MIRCRCQVEWSHAIYSSHIISDSFVFSSFQTSGHPSSCIGAARDSNHVQWASSEGIINLMDAEVFLDILRVEVSIQ